MAALEAQAPSATEACVLETRKLTKVFEGFVAVDGIDLRVRRGAIHALIGPNGAGKTTVFNLLTKFVTPTSGTIFYQGKDITEASASDVAHMGIGRSFQISAVFPQMTALENVRVALQGRSKLSHQFWRRGSLLRAFDGRARELLETVGLAQFAERKASELPYGLRRALEIATTFALEPELIMLDEPTQGMGHEDVAPITALIRKMAAGRTVLIVEHNLNVVAELCDTITVLTRGKILAEGSYDAISQNTAVREAYIGRAR